MNEILDLIKKAPCIAVYTHVNPDGDCNGCAFGIRQLIWDNVDSKKKIKVVGKDCPAYLTFIGPYDDMSDSFAKKSLSIVVDTSTAARVSDQRFLKGTKIIKIDHHLDSADFGHVNIVEHLTSCAELVVKIAESVKWKITKEAAKPLLSGMITDTGRFRHLKNSPETLAKASRLLATGIDLQEGIYSPLYSREPSGVLFQAWYLRNIKFKNKCAYIVIDEKVIAKFSLKLEEASEWIGQLRDFRGVLLWAQFVKYPDYWRCEYRSSGYPVNEFAKAYGGGGHKNAAGSRARDLRQVKNIISNMEVINE